MVVQIWLTQKTLLTNNNSSDSGLTAGKACIIITNLVTIQIITKSVEPTSIHGTNSRFKLIEANAQISFFDFGYSDD